MSATNEYKCNLAKNNLKTLFQKFQENSANNSLKQIQKASNEVESACGRVRPLTVNTVRTRALSRNNTSSSPNSSSVPEFSSENTAFLLKGKQIIGVKRNDDNLEFKINFVIGEHAIKSGFFSRGKPERQATFTWEPKDIPGFWKKDINHREQETVYKDQPGGFGMGQLPEVDHTIPETTTCNYYWIGPQPQQGKYPPPLLNPDDKCNETNYLIATPNLNDKQATEYIGSWSWISTPTIQFTSPPLSRNSPPPRIISVSGTGPHSPADNALPPLQVPGFEGSTASVAPPQVQAAPPQVPEAPPPTQLNLRGPPLRSVKNDPCVVANNAVLSVTTEIEKHIPDERLRTTIRDLIAEETLLKEKAITACKEPVNIGGRRPRTRKSHSKRRKGIRRRPSTRRRK